MDLLKTSQLKGVPAIGIRHKTDTVEVTFVWKRSTTPADPKEKKTSKTDPNSTVQPRRPRRHPPIQRRRLHRLLPSQSRRRSRPMWTNIHTFVNQFSFNGLEETPPRPTGQILQEAETTAFHTTFSPDDQY